MGNEQSNRYNQTPRKRTNTCFRIGKKRYCDTDDESSIDSHEASYYDTYNKSYRTDFWDSTSPKKTPGEKFNEFWEKLFKINKRKKYDDSIFFPYDEMDE